MVKIRDYKTQFDIFRRIVGGEKPILVAKSYDVTSTCAIQHMCLVSEMIRDFLPKTLDSVRIMSRYPNTKVLRENADFWLESLGKLEESVAKKGKSKMTEQDQCCYREKIKP